MKEIKYPVEMFFWNLHDSQGNTTVEIRDADKNFIINLSIKGHDYYEEKRLINEIVPMIVGLINEDALKPVEVSPDTVISNGNGSNSNKRGKR